jgi:hypothetical protein
MEVSTDAGGLYFSSYRLVRQNRWRVPDQLMPGIQQAEQLRHLDLVSARLKSRCSELLYVLSTLWTARGRVRESSVKVIAFRSTACGAHRQAASLPAQVTLRHSSECNRSYGESTFHRYAVGSLRGCRQGQLFSYLMR